MVQIDIGPQVAHIHHDGDSVSLAEGDRRLGGFKWRQGAEDEIGLAGTFRCQPQKIGGEAAVVPNSLEGAVGPVSRSRYEIQLVTLFHPDSLPRGVPEGFCEMDKG